MRSVAVVCAFLCLVVALASCGDSEITQVQGQITQGSDQVVPAGDGALGSLSDRELLVLLLAKVDALETRLDQESRLARALVDTLRSSPEWGAVVSLAASAAAGWTPPTLAAGGVPLDLTQLVARTDTIVARTDTIIARSGVILANQGTAATSLGLLAATGDTLVSRTDTIIGRSGVSLANQGGLATKLGLLAASTDTIYSRSGMILQAGGNLALLLDRSQELLQQQNKLDLLVAQGDTILDNLFDNASQSLCFDLPFEISLAGQFGNVMTAGVGGGVGIDVYGNGIDVNLEGVIEVANAISLGVSPTFSYSYCLEPGLSRSAAASSSAMRSSGMMPDIEGAFNAIGLNEGTVATALSASRAVLSGQPDFLQLIQTTASVPVPPAVYNLIRNPNTMVNSVKSAGEQAVSGMCTNLDLYPTDIRSLVQEACRIQLPGLQTLIPDLTPLQNSITAMRTGTQTFCNGVNGLVDKMNSAAFTLPKQEISVAGVDFTTFPRTTIDLFPGTISRMGCAW